jgi:23S rRNA pseudouridine1911/1915/1917 synthase
LRRSRSAAGSSGASSSLTSDVMPDPLEKLTFRVEPEAAGARLDTFLASHAADFSRSRLKALIKEGLVTLDSRVLEDPNARLTAGAEITLTVPEAVPANPQAEAIPLKILFEDADIIVIDKPVGLVVHPGAGNQTGTLVNALIAHCGESLSGIGGVRRPGIVHRLDKDTSGVLVVAKNDEAHRTLSAQFAKHGRDGVLEREYDALVWGVPKPHIGEVDAPLNRDVRNRQKQAVARSGGRSALTRYALKERYQNSAALLACRLATGRTHQIRVHMAHIGHPLVGDAVYGGGFLTKAETLPDALRAVVRGFGRQALHARLLRFRHPRTGASLQFEADWPTDLTNLIELFRKLAV